MRDEKPGEKLGTCFVVMGFGKKTDFETGRTKSPLQFLKTE